MQMDLEFNALAALSAMITPAVLISACGSLLIATSNRLGRVIDRTRSFSEKFERLMHEEVDEDLGEEERTIVFRQLERATRRSRLLQRSMVNLYLALAIFVATSVALGVHYLSGRQFAWLPLLLGLVGAAFLFSSSLLLIVESRVALSAVDDEMDFVLRLRRHHAPSDLLREPERRWRRRPWFPRR